jgi:hypothetical protein
MTQYSATAWEEDETVRHFTRFNPLCGNPLANRDDLARAVMGFYAPLRDCFSDGNSRLRLGTTGAHYGGAAVEMEALIRPLWGLAPMVAGGWAFDDIERYVAGISNGTDPDHAEYWGDVGAHDQRMVEMAGLSLAFILAPNVFWEPLSIEAKQRVSRWMRTINDYPTADNNWLFFRVLTNLALRQVGEPWSDDAIRAALDRLDEFHLADGYYRDGKWYQLDYYIPMGFHFYGLMVAQLAGDLYPEHAARYRERARRFAQDFQHWFADDGAAIPFGRSMTYRFAQAAFWAACAFAGEEVLPWGRIKGLLLRHLRWWGTQPITGRDGILSVGYSYPNLMMSEAYNAPGSPYWALKTFLVLSLPETHPFWMAQEEAPNLLPNGRIASPASGFIMRRAPGDAVVLTGGQDGREHRCFDAKYGRFAYSSAFAFSVASDAGAPDRPERSAVDSGLMVSRDGVAWMSRNRITEAGFDHDMAWGRWQPDGDLSIDSWVDFGGLGWHVRLHKIVTHVPLHVAESGFSIDRTGDGHQSPQDWFEISTGCGFVRSLSAVSGIVDLLSDRQASIIRASPNTNLRFPRTFFPRLAAQVPAGTSWLATACFAKPDPSAEVTAMDVPETLLAFCRVNGIALLENR